MKLKEIQLGKIYAYEGISRSGNVIKSIFCPNKIEGSAIYCDKILFKNGIFILEFLDDIVLFNKSIREATKEEVELFLDKNNDFAGDINVGSK